MSQTKIISNAAGCAPRALSHSAYRNLISIPYDAPDGLTFKVAREAGELVQAFRLLHDAYVEAGFTRPTRSGLRVTKHHALPTSPVLIIKDGDLVVATLTIIVRTGFRLPIETLFDIGDRLRPGRRAAEVSALAIHRDYRGEKGRVLFPLLKYMYEYAHRGLGVTDLFLTCNPKHIQFYEAVLAFVQIVDGKVETSDFVDGAPAVGAWLDLAAAPRIYLELYRGKRREKNLHTYFVENEIEALPRNEAPPWGVEGVRWSRETFSLFFGGRDSPLASASAQEVGFLRRAFAGTEIADLLKTLLPIPGLGLKPSADVAQVAAKGPILLKPSYRPRAEWTTGRLFAMSQEEASLDVDVGLDTDGPFDIVAEFRPGLVSQVVGVRRWTDGKGRLALDIPDPDVAWRHAVSALESRRVAPSLRMPNKGVGDAAAVA